MFTQLFIENLEKMMTGSLMILEQKLNNPIDFTKFGPYPCTCTEFAITNYPLSQLTIPEGWFWIDELTRKKFGVLYSLTHRTSMAVLSQI